MLHYPFKAIFLPLCLLLLQAQSSSPSFNKPFNPLPSHDQLANDPNHHPSSDPDYYDDKAYYEYASAYQDNLRVSAAAAGAATDDEQDDEDYADSDKEQAKAPVKKELSYSERASELNCDNPWFWYAIQCTWLDVKGDHFGERRTRNATTSAWLIGGGLSLLLSWLCACYCLYCLKWRKRAEMMRLRKEYEPGRMKLPNGKVVKFQPTSEEVKAYEELVKAIIIQEMI